MKTTAIAGFLIAIVIGCAATKTNVPHVNSSVSQNDTVRIANDSLQYEVTIIDAGFQSWLESMARPRNFYALTFLETKNLFWVAEYNRRVLQPYRYDPNLYEMRIDYEPQIRYGFEVNYLIYNYLLYFQKSSRQKL